MLHKNLILNMCSEKDRNFDYKLSELEANKPKFGLNLMDLGANLEEHITFKF